MKNRIIPHVPKKDRVSLSEGSNWKLRGFWDKPKPYIPPTEEELITRDLKEREDRKRMRRDLARSILQEDPEFLQELIVELRQKKIEQIKG